MARWRSPAARHRRPTDLIDRAPQAQAPHGQLRIRIRRLAEGASEVKRLRLVCSPGGKPTTYDITVEEGRRMTVVLEGSEFAEVGDDGRFERVTSFAGRPESEPAF